MFKIYSMNMAGLSFWGSNVKALHMFLVHSVIYLGTRNTCASQKFSLYYHTCCYSSSSIPICSQTSRGVSQYCSLEHPPVSWVMEGRVEDTPRSWGEQWKNMSRLLGTQLFPLATAWFFLNLTELSITCKPRASSPIWESLHPDESKETIL